MLSPQFSTFETMAEDVFKDGGEIDELFWWIIDGLGRVFLQQGLNRKPVCGGEERGEHLFQHLFEHLFQHFMCWKAHEVIEGKD